MKTKTCLGISLVLVLGTAACGGTSSLGESGSNVTGDGGPGMGGFSGGGGTGQGGDPNSGGDPGMGGATMGCTSDMECIVPTGPCEICADGTYVCPSGACVNGACTVSYPGCGGMTPMCNTDSDCGAIGAPCEMCPDGSSACPKTWCNMGICEAVFPTCSKTIYEPCAGRVCGESCDLCDPMDPNCAQVDLLLTCDAYGQCGVGTPDCSPVSTTQCMSAMDCPQSLAVCQICADGSAACPKTDCVNGECYTEFPVCPDPMLGECTTDADCPQLDGPCQMCADGSSACPGMYCKAGACVMAYPTCSTYDPCANKVCGDSCTLCPPDDMTCVETADIKACDTEGVCRTANFVCPMF